MFRFTDLVRGNEIVRDVKQKYPETEPVLERFGLRPSCYDCSIQQAARKVGVEAGDVVAALNEVIAKGREVGV
ncbi:MAG: hypothetical protein ACE145_04600 [Terriglobia bacterium]